MSTISSDDVSHLARLSRLNLTEEESGRFAGQLSSVVAYVEQLSGVDVRGMEAQHGVTGLVNVLAEDAIRTSDDPLAVSRESLLAGAPATANHLFQVRAVLGDEASAA